MSRYLLDTTLVAAYLLGRPPLRPLVRPWVRAREMVTSILVYGEVVEYLASRSDFARRYRVLRRMMERTAPPLPLTYAVMEGYADLRRQLRPPHGPGLIGDIDTLIAATALTDDLIVVTTDGDFERVPGLKYLLLDRTTFAITRQRV